MTPPNHLFPNERIDHLLKTYDRVDAIKAALSNAQTVWENYLRLPTLNSFRSLLILRDWQGRFHLGIPGKDKFQSADSDARDELKQALHALKVAAGDLAYTNTGDTSGFEFFSDELFDAASLWASTDKVLWDELHPVAVYWIERQGKEKIWTQSPPPSNMQHPLRVVFFGIKGGVGRSSALLATAYHFMKQDKKVLVLDADFESPGVSATLLAEDLRPKYGLLDWFALDALAHNAAQTLIQERQLFERSGLDALQEDANGTVWVAPSFGKDTQDYVGKLGRLYQDVRHENYVQRFQRLLTTLESELQPDLVLIDSRAGVDDTAALALTQLNAYGLLFATHGRATWAAYTHLFSHWQRFAHLHRGGQDFRAQLRMVSALTPVDATYDRRLLDASYRLFLNHLYEVLEADQLEGDGFNYGIDDEDAPHWPLRVRWDEMLRHFDPIQNPAQLDEGVFQKAFGEFLPVLEQWLEWVNSSEEADDALEGD